jgi:hypothetical protein
MLHNTIPLGHIHAIHNWEVDNAAALASLTPIETDRGKLAWQLDTNEFFFLVSHIGPIWAGAIGIQGIQGIQGEVGATGPAGTNAPKILPVACSDEITAITAGLAKVTFRMPYAMTLSAVRASLSTAQTSGTVVTVDINETGISILSTKLTIDNTEKTSTTAATAAVISDTSLADDAEITIDVDLVGDGTAKGLKVYLIGS